MVSLNCVITNFKQNVMITKSKPSRAAPPDPCTWDLLIGIGTPPEKFLPTPLKAVYTWPPSTPYYVNDMPDIYQALFAAPLYRLNTLLSFKRKFSTSYNIGNFKVSYVDT